MDAAVGPIDGFPFCNQLLRIGLTEAARISEASRDFLVAIELREIGFVGNGGDEHLAAFFGGADAPHLHSWTLDGEQAEIVVDVFGVIENIRCSDDVME